MLQATPEQEVEFTQTPFEHPSEQFCEVCWYEQSPPAHVPLLENTILEVPLHADAGGELQLEFCAHCEQNPDEQNGVEPMHWIFPVPLVKGGNSRHESES